MKLKTALEICLNVLWNLWNIYFSNSFVKHKSKEKIIRLSVCCKYLRNLRDNPAAHLYMQYITYKSFLSGETGHETQMHMLPTLGHIPNESYGYKNHTTAQPNAPNGY